MIPSEEEAEKIIDRILSFSKADSVSVSLTGSNSINLRFALNSVSTCGAIDSISVDITSNVGKKSGTARVTSIEDKSIQSGVRLSEDIARLSPENEEFMLPVEKQQNYLEVKEFFENTNGLTPRNISEKISYTLDSSIKKNLLSAGYFEKEAGFLAVGNTNNLFAYHKNTSAAFSSTIRTSDGNGSSKIRRSYADVSLLDIKNLSDKVIERSVLSQNPVEYPPGKYVTILDNSAVCDMVYNLIGFMNRRPADEGRSFFSDKDKKNKLGEMIVDSQINLYSDPQSKEAPSTPFTAEGYPILKTVWIDKGILENLYSTRYWAKKTDSEYVPFPSNILMTGTDKTVEDLISSTEDGVFVTRFWYMRTVDPKQILLTGLTRDGVFKIENGKIKHPIKNYRFNESPINMLKNIIDMARSEKIVGSETGNAKIVVPALKLSEFNFSTISDAI